MSKLKLIGFSGETPKIIPRLLGDTGAQLASNVRLDDGGLTPTRKKRQEFQFTPGTDYLTVYKNGTEWLGWSSNVYAVPGPVATDRLYVTGDGVPKMIVAGVEYPLALDFPAAALTATLSGTPTPGASGTTRIYVYTWVTAFGEESAPSPASADVFWTPGETLTLSGFVLPPSGRNITSQRIYRAQTGKTGTQLYLIDERIASAGDYIDNISPELLQEALPSATWDTPPDDLNGLIALPNGMMAAFSGKQLCFSEPYRPHAWPEGYRLTMDYPIVGLGSFVSSVVVTTQGTPYLVTGTAPENMVSEELEENLPCINARGIVDLGYSVVYPSHDGLVQITNSGARVASTNLFSRDDWLRLNPGGMTASHYNGRYFTTFSYIDPTGAPYVGLLIIDFTGEQPFLIRSNLYATAMYYDLPTGSLFLLIDDVLYEWDALSQPSDLLAWKSKLFVLPTPTNFGAILIEADSNLTAAQDAAIEAEIAAIIASNALLFAGDSLGGELNGAAMNEYPINGDMLQPVPSVARTVMVNVYADQVLVGTVTKVNQMARLKSGFKARRWEVEVASDMALTQITLAGTGAELREV